MGGSESRRDFLGDIFTSAGKVVTRRVGQIAKAIPEPQTSQESYLSLLRPPDSIRVFTASDVQRLNQMRGGLWEGVGTSVRTTILTDRQVLTLEAPGLEP